MISDNIEITSHCKPCSPLAVKQLITLASVCVCMCVSLSVNKFILIYLWRTCWYHEFQTTGSAFSGMTTMMRDFKPILRLIWWAYTRGKNYRVKIDLNLSAGSTYMRVYMVIIKINRWNAIDNFYFSVSCFLTLGHQMDEIGWVNIFLSA